MQAEGALDVILPKVRDPRVVTIPRGGALTERAAAPAERLVLSWLLLMVDDGPQ
jgi:hypothetical protein